MFLPLLLAQPPLVTQMQITPMAALERLFSTPAPQPEWFAESFLTQVPLTQIEQIVAGFRASLGPYQSVQPQGESYQIQFEKGKLLARIAVNDSGQITGLLLQPQSDAIAPSEAIQQLQALPGQTNLLILETGPYGSGEAGRPLATHNADLPLAVGSTFKLAVLAALQEQISKGDPSRVSRRVRAWSDVVELRPEDKSLPSGFLQTWFDGALLTVQSLATLMISQSDNTATDALMRLLGRRAIAPFAARNHPLLTTREFFALKNPENEALLQRYRTGDRGDRLEVLKELTSSPLPDASLFTNKPIALDVEWFFTPQELCGLMEKVADLPLMSINPGGGLVDPNQWERVSFKGGSEPGVLNLTTSLKSMSGKTYCVSTTWNNPDAAVDETRFYTLYSGILEGLRDRP
jgi:beta-lactamase class A